uniref:BrnT family toxin n=1 Tax=uncultured Thiotrichaceae bacterium TaxID=298394 RepID=A0A6S6SEJ9_9GAMM|nr:MAG: Unknown protein [uncultured Thiotrichaceae bacterium]
MQFEWDDNKAKSNLKKHDISFQEATTTFSDTMGLTFDDSDHSVGELRLLTFGRTKTDKLLVVSHTELEEGKIRLISARPMTKQEQRIYQDG